MALIDTNKWGSTTEVDTSRPANATKPVTGFIDGLKATWAQENVYAPNMVRPSLEYADDHSFDYKTYDKRYWPLVAAARNRDHADDLIKEFDVEQVNKQVMDNQSFVTGLATNALVGLTNPLNYLGFGPAKTIGGAALKGAAGAVLGTALTEPILQARQVDRSATESAMNIAGAAVFGAPLGAAGKMVSNKLSGAPMFGTSSQPAAVKPANVELYSSGSVGAARTTERTMADASIARLPEWMTRFSVLGDLSRSTNQRLSTSSFQQSRNAANALLRQNLATAENLAGTANQVPIEIAAGQRFGESATQLMQTDSNLRQAWFSKVEGGTYSQEDIMVELRRIDPELPENYRITETTFDKLLKAHMADSNGMTSTMSEIVQRVEAGAKVRESLDADKIDYGFYAKDKLINLTTGERVVKPEDSVDAVMLAKLKAERSELSTELAAARDAKLPKADLDEFKGRLKEHDAKIEARKAALEQRKADYESLVPSSKTHKLAYEDGSHYLSRVFDKGRILHNREGFTESLIQGWMARNPDIDYLDAELAAGLRAQADLVVDKLLGDDRVVSLGDLKENLDLPGKYIKDRTLSIDDVFLTKWMHDNVLATELHHLSQATVDVEMAKSGVRYDEIIRGINDEFKARVDEINGRVGQGSATAVKEVNALAQERAKDVEQLEYVMNRLKRKPGTAGDLTSNSVASWVSRANRVAGMAQLGSSAFPNSLGDVASIARNFGTSNAIRTMLKGVFSKEFRDEIAANAKQVGVLTEFINQSVRDIHVNEMLNQSLDPNKGFKSVGLQRVDNGLDRVSDVFSKVSLIEPWAKVGRTVASAASSQHIIEAASKGWSKLPKTTQMDMAKFYIDEAMLGRIQQQVAAHADDVEGIKFAGVDKWTDPEAARVFKASVYAHTEHALNIPSIGTGSQWMSDTLTGRIFMRFKSFNNAAHESTFLASLQNREASRIVTGTLNYSFWGFLSLYTYDTITGRPNDIDDYFGDGDKATKTAWKMFTKTGYMAAGQDAFVNASKLAGQIPGPIGEGWRSAFPEGLENELFPKYEDVSTAEKLLGPTYGYLSKAVKAAGGLMDGEVSDKDVGNIRSTIPGQNIGWLRRGLDYIEEYFGGRKADRFADGK